ncbi:MAG: hypothetical protein ACP5E5_14980, partial [Acidobacteriaceae bacterium]
RQPKDGVVTSTYPPPATFNYARDILPIGWPELLRVYHVVLRPYTQLGSKRLVADLVEFQAPV